MTMRSKLGLSRWAVLVGIVILATNPTSVANATNTITLEQVQRWQADHHNRFHHPRSGQRFGEGVPHHPHHNLRTSHAKRELTKNGTDTNPLKISNMCHETIWPAIIGGGVGPGTGGFELPPETTVDLYVGSNWSGRIWGRTNCSFDEHGTGPAEGSNAVNGWACSTGDCGGLLECEVSGAFPSTLVEITLTGGENNMQTYYDISLVDGYNLPMGVKYIPGKNTTFIPPNLTNAACIATKGYLKEPSVIGSPENTTMAVNDTYPVPLEGSKTNDALEKWCPFNLLAYPPGKPGWGVYPYPDDDIRRPIFAPCLSQCAKTNAKEDCCTDEYNDPKKCKPGLYSQDAKVVCPDAYSFAYDDTVSTFMIPKGGGWEVVFCPEGRSTNILATFGAELLEIAATSVVTDAITEAAQNGSLIQARGGSGGVAEHVPLRTLGTILGLALGTLFAI